MEIASFVDELTRNVEKYGWEPNDTGYQVITKNFIIKIRKSDGSNIELVVDDYDGKEIAKALQKPVPEGADDNITLKLAFLYQNLEKKPIDRVAALDDVVRELRTGRGGS
ncbi:MAG TPA: hypothetical protein VII22_25750 [Streptosporangiaceae bacterium]